MAFRRRPDRPPDPFWRRVKVPLLIFLPLFFAFAVVHVSRAHHDICGICYSSRSTTVEGLGTDPFHPWKETEHREDVRPSHACMDFFGGACPHRWQPFSTRASFFVFMTMTGGTLVPQPLASQYENAPRFYGVIGKKVESGELPREELRAAMMIPAEPTAEDLADPERRRLISLGVRLLQLAGERDSGTRWEKALERSKPGAVAIAPPK
jgi:hypothetical protein